MRVHFFYRNFRDTVIVLEEGNPHHSLCPRCDMLLNWSALNRSHLTTAQWPKVTEKNIRQLVEEDLRESFERVFQAYG